MNILKVENLRAAYGAVRVIHGVDIEVNQGEIVALLGANGAGKTTILRAISGVLSYTGTCELLGSDISKIPAAARLRLGISHIPQGRGTFVDFSVEENLALGAFCISDRREVKRQVDKWFGIFPRLAERRSQIAGSLSGGEQQMLAVARALMSKPKLLLCDEPSLGLAPAITDNLFETLCRLNKEEGLSILLVEQNANITLPIAHRAYVMEIGHITVSRDASTLLTDPSVRRAYLGVHA